MTGITDLRRKRAVEIAEKIKEHHGSITAVSMDLGISRRTIYNYRDDFPEVAEAIEDARLATGELIEGKLVEQALAGNITAMIFYLKTQRGWRETNRMEIDAKVEASTSYNEEQVAAFNAKLDEWNRQLTDGGYDEEE